jgi:hypothetical protein
MNLEDAIYLRYKSVSSKLNECSLRHFVTAEAKQ